MMKREDFEESLGTPLQFWSNKSQIEVRTLLGSETAGMVYYNQKNPHHCYDLFLHTLHTVRLLGVDSPITLRVAAFFHDIGKPFVAQKKQGRLVFYGHAKKSAEIAKPLIIDMGYSLSEANLICFYISHHDDFISWVLPTESYDHGNPYLVEITQQNVANHIYEVFDNNELPNSINTYELWANLLKLCHADVDAQADYVYMNSNIIDSKEHKSKKLEAINITLNSIFS